MSAKLAMIIAAGCLTATFTASAAPTAGTSPTANAAAAPAPTKKAAEPTSRKPTAEERAEAERMDPLAQAAFWTRDLDVDPRDVDGAVRLAKALRTLTRYDEAQSSAARALVIAPNNLDALLEDARDFIAGGQGFFAIEPATRAAKLAPKDWRPPSLLAVGLEQAQRDDEALAAFNRALSLAPTNPATLSNLAMFYAAHGQKQRAESLLRQAVASPAAGAQERQNLALVLGLEGRLDEAERLQRQDLPPEVVANDQAYLRADQGLVPDRSWNSVSSAQ